MIFGKARGKTRRVARMKICLTVMMDYYYYARHATPCFDSSYFVICVLLRLWRREKQRNSRENVVDKRVVACGFSLSPPPGWQWEFMWLGIVCAVRTRVMWMWIEYIISRLGSQLTRSFWQHNLHALIFFLTNQRGHTGKCVCVFVLARSAVCFLARKLFVRFVVCLMLNKLSTNWPSHAGATKPTHTHTQNRKTFVYQFIPRAVFQLPRNHRFLYN